MNFSMSTAAQSIWTGLASLGTGAAIIADKPAWLEGFLNIIKIDDNAKILNNPSFANIQQILRNHFQDKKQTENNKRQEAILLEIGNAILQHSAQAIKTIGYSQKSLNDSQSIHFSVGFGNDKQAQVITITKTSGCIQQYIIPTSGTPFKVSDINIIPLENQAPGYSIHNPAVLEAHKNKETKKPAQSKDDKNKKPNGPNNPKDPNNKNPDNKASGANNKNKKIPTLNDPESIEFFKNLVKDSIKEAFHNQFGNLFKDPKTNLWWSKDTAFHGGAHYKVFKETAKGLAHQFNADLLGNEIIGQHKGGAGSFIPWKEIILK